jgi:uncharacterized membrane protein
VERCQSDARPVWEVAKVRRYLLLEILLFAPLLGFAAAMARGYGEF